MIIKIDSREQTPLDFTVGGAVSRIDVIGLPVADYWGELENGTEIPTIFERKTIPDLFGTLTNGMDRFKKEINKAIDNNLQLVIIIEGSITNVLSGVKYSKAKGASIIKTLNTLFYKYGVVHTYCNDREEMKRIILESFEGFGRTFKKRNPAP